MGDGPETGKNGNKGATARQDEETGDPARTTKLAEIQSLEAALRDARESIGEPAGNTSNDAVKAIIKGQTDRHLLQGRLTSDCNDLHRSVMC